MEKEDETNGYGKVIPATNEQTASGRRRRFRAELCHLLDKRGWVVAGSTPFHELQTETLG
jgi:hypothetical protein